MPDTKLSWPMLKEHLRKYLWIYITGIVVCLILSSLLWTTTRPQPSNAESVTVYLMGSYARAEALDKISADMLARGQAEDEKLKAVEFQWLQYTGGDGDYTGSLLLMTRLAVGEGDAFIAGAEALDTLAASGTLMPLDDLIAEGWLDEYGLEVWYAEITDEDTGETQRFPAGLRLDKMEGLAAIGAFDNRGAALCLSITSQNPETTRRTLEVMMEDLQKETENAGTEG